MTDRETLVGLRERVAKLSGPDREVDAAILNALALDKESTDRILGPVARGSR